MSRVLFLTNSISGGGAEKSIYNLCNYLSTLGLDIHLCAINESPEDVFLSSNFPVHLLNRKWKDGFPSTFKAFTNYTQLIQKLKPNYIIANCELPELFSAFTPKNLARLILVEHTSKPWRGRKILGFLVRNLLALRKPKWVTVNSAQSRIWMGSKNPKYIPNSINMQTLIPKEGIEFADLVFIGRLNSDKRPELAIQAALANDLSLALFGDGPIREDLEDKFLGWRKQICFFGFDPNPWFKVSRGSLVVVPSRFEGDGMVIVEAILRGNPLLLADVPDLRRFNLPESMYFKDLKSLIIKIKSGKMQDFAEYFPSSGYIETLNETRDIRNVAKSWLELMGEA